ncbi:hypothetical protein EON63_24555 [archaeon]|nr:MAG: hypothetical protein EON63_24555 [archaeon]
MNIICVCGGLNIIDLCVSSTNVYVMLFTGDDKDDEEGDDGAGLAEEEEEVEEVSGYHFMECTTLFVSYVYITSGTAYSLDNASTFLVLNYGATNTIYHTPYSIHHMQHRRYSRID